FASDLNPVACLILKVMLEDIPRHGPKLAEELRRVGAEIKKQAEKELAQYYPRDPDGATPIAYLWARTVTCESPNCGAEIPLVRSFWLCKKAARLRALRVKILKPSGKTPHIEFEVFTPKSEKEVASGTVTRAKATCLACERVLAPDRVRAQLRDQRSGADTIFDAKGNRIGGARLLAVVTLKDEKAGRQYRVATDRDYAANFSAQRAIEKLAKTNLSNGLSPIPDEPLPPQGTLGFRVQLYGMSQWGDLFTARQKLALTKLVEYVRPVASNPVADALALTVSKLSELACSICAWEPLAECPRHIFGRQAIPIAWDFGEGVLTSSSSGSFEVSAGNTLGGIESIGNVREG